MCSDLGRKCLLAFSIALVICSAQAGDDDGENNCNIKPDVISCDKNKLKYRVVVDDPKGDRIVFNHSIERIPATKPTRRVRSKRPGVNRSERVSAIRTLLGEKRAVWREKLALLIAKRRAKLRRERKRAMNKPVAR